MQELSGENKINQKLIVNENEIYSSWDLSLRDLPPRSELISLAPINIGTSNVECLLSYFSRLAFEYSVSPTIFLNYVISKSTISSELTKNLRLSGKLNCMSSETEILIDILQELTRRTDIYFTTLLPYKGKFCSIKSIRKEKVWCSLCFTEQAITLKLNYEKLVWTLEPVERCSTHQITLENKCPNCNAVAKKRTKYLRPGYCSNCLKWLGNHEYLKSNIQTQNIISEAKKKRKLKN